MKNKIHNCMYMMKYAYQVAPIYYTIYIILSILINTVSSGASVLLFKVMIDNVQTGKSYGQAIRPLFVIGAILAVNIIFDATFHQYNQAKTTRISGKIQAQIMEKAAGMDIIHYDQNEFYNDIIYAASRGEEEIFSCIQRVLDLIGSVSRVAGVIGILTSLDYILVIFPFTACLIAYFLRKKTNRLEYEMFLKLNPVRRKCDYFFHTFYRMEYAKEIRLTNISESLIKQYRSASEEESNLNTKYGRRTLPLKVLDFVILSIGLVHYLPMLYLGYNTRVTNRLSISKMSALQNGTNDAYEKIAIVGHNGAGKSTFIKLLLHLYDPTDGEILYDGVNVKEYDTKQYRNVVSSVFQDFQIYALSVGDNVMMRETQQSDESRIESLCDWVQLKDKVNTLPNGTRTQLTREFDEEGTLLSGGEAQKLAIARAFAKKSPIMILDEASSALDPVAEYNLNHLMMKAGEKATCIFISHRLSTTKMADRIYLFENGEILEQGSHEELMKLDGEYAKMYRNQAKYYKMA